MVCAAGLRRPRPPAHDQQPGGPGGDSPIHCWQVPADRARNLEEKGLVSLRAKRLSMPGLERAPTNRSCCQTCLLPIVQNHVRVIVQVTDGRGWRGKRKKPSSGSTSACAFLNAPASRSIADAVHQRFSSSGVLHARKFRGV